MVDLATLVKDWGGHLDSQAAASSSGAGADVLRVRLDSRLVQVGDLFVALEGRSNDGSQFALEALARGASAILAPAALKPDWHKDQAVPVWIHPQARSIAGHVAAQLLGHPSRGMFVAAVTGTNGKTTTAHLIAQLLACCGKRSGVLGTSGNRLADGQVREATHTTPDAPSLQEWVALHRSLGGDALALEASSHALDQERLAGLDVAVAVFTNLTRDHLDYHGSMQAYAAAKRRLFEHLTPKGCAVVRADDPWSATMIQAARQQGARVITYSTRSDADLVARDVAIGPTGTRFTIQGMGIHSTGVSVPLMGRYNVENTLAAIAAVLVGGASPSTLLAGLASVSSAPGRLERVPLDAPFEVYVDYAHTPDALAHVLATLREACAADPASQGAGRRRLICVFGCGGDRDQGKRAPMGKIASELCDLVVVTSDNPRSEDARGIAEQIFAGVAPCAAHVVAELDRRAAIARAMRGALAGDVILVAGKGHETTQEIAGTKTAFDDRVVCQEVWASGASSTRSGAGRQREQ